MKILEQFLSHSCHPWDTARDCQLQRMDSARAVATLSDGLLGASPVSIDGSARSRVELSRDRRASSTTPRALTHQTATALQRGAGGRDAFAGVLGADAAPET